jgi:hypothetical protein
VQPKLRSEAYLSAITEWILYTVSPRYTILGGTFSEDLLNDCGGDSASGPVDIRVIPASPHGGKTNLSLLSLFYFDGIRIQLGMRFACNNLISKRSLRNEVANFTRGMVLK